MTGQHCTVCGIALPGRRTRVVLARRHIVCVPCTGTPAAHALTAPDCPEAWHDAWDHEHVLCLARTAEHLTRQETGR